MTRLARAAAVITVGAALLATWLPPAHAATPTPAVVMTLNVAGGQNRGNPSRVTRDVLAVVNRERPDIIGLQEVCHRQHRDLRAKLAKLGYRATHTTTLRSGRCNDKAQGNRFGNSLFVRGGFQSRARTRLPWGANPAGTVGREPRAMVCVTTSGTRVCNVHIGPRTPDRDRQIATVAAAVQGYDDVILLGDWNAWPGQVRRHMPRLRTATEGIDHVFSTRAGQARTYHVPSSDHDAVVVTLGEE